MPGKPAAILFDLDDTILDFEAPAGPAWSEVTRRFEGRYRGQRGAVDPEAVRAEIARVSAAWWSDPERHRQGRLALQATRRRNVAEALANLGVADHSLSLRLADAFAEARTAAICLFPGARQTLQHFRDAGVPMALVTNGDSAGQRAKIERFDLADFFQAIVVEEEFGAGKPDERIFGHALDALGAAAAATWMVGDNLDWEIEPCRRLGLYTVWVDLRGQGLPVGAAVEPHRTVRAIAELID